VHHLFLDWSTCGSLLAGGPGCQEGCWGTTLAGGWVAMARGARAGEAVGTLAGSEFPASIVG
jgi:hypothetical protein